MWELSSFCNLNSASVCISIKIQSLLITHSILGHVSVHRRDRAEFLLTVFLLCCSVSSLSHATKIFFWRQIFFPRFPSQCSQLQGLTASLALVTVFWHHPLCIVCHCFHFADKEQRCTDVQFKGIHYFGGAIQNPLRPCFLSCLSHLLHWVPQHTRHKDQTHVVGVLRRREAGCCRKSPLMGLV